MLKKKSPIAAMGLATGAIALDSVWPAFHKLILLATLNLVSLLNFNGLWLTLQRFLENGYAQLSVVNGWHYLVILGAVILEGPMATMLGGVWASMGQVNVWAILLVSITAGIIADSFWYYLGYFGREQMIDRWGRYAQVDITTINRLEEVLFGDNAMRVVFTAKLTSALIIPTLIAAGLTNMGWRKVIKTMATAQVLWSVGLTAVGFLAADSFIWLSSCVEHLGWIAGGMISLIFISRVAYRRQKYRQ